MDAKKELQKKRIKFELNSKTGLSSGSTMLNLACTDTPYWAFVAGGYYFLWGDSSSGKTWLSMTCFAEAQLASTFKDHELIFIDTEGGAMMDIEHYFGPKVAKKIQPFEIDTIQEFYRLMDKLLVKEKRKCIIVLDSENGMDNSAAKKKFQKEAKAVAEGEKEKGSFGDGKAKYHSENIRWVRSSLRKTGSILIVIGQSRDNPNAWGFADKKVRSGGKSLSFYANLEMISTKGKPIRKEVRGKLREVGSTCIVTVRKNRVTGKVGKERSATIPIYLGLGIDDVGSIVDFLIDEQYFTLKRVDEKKRKIWKVPDLDLAGTRNAIVRFIDENDAHEVFQDMASKVWKEIEDECMTVNRKNRYAAN